ncbi:MAG TPA: hypothetical protein VL096_04915, partial [Pirellulaceae bacterium]|nr:hypothetical protein [Pirellulaceae bacterium]
GLGKLQTLCLSGKEVTSKTVAAAVAQFPKLERLYLADSAIAGDGLIPLKKLSQLRQLSLAGTSIKDTDLAPLAALPKLTWLSLDGTTLSDDALPHLAALKQLRVLSLDDNLVATNEQMMDKSVLPETPQRKGVRITDAGLEELKTSLKDCQIISREPDAQRLVARWVLDQGGMVAVANGEQSLKVGKRDDLPRNACKIVAISLKGAERLKLEQLGAKLRECQELTFLDLSDLDLNDQQLAALAAVPNLEILSLAKTQVTDAGFVHIGKLAKLRVLNLQSAFVNGSGLAKYPLPKLTQLNVGSTEFNATGLKALKASPELVELDLTFCPGVNAAGLAEIATLEKLQLLDLKGTTINDSAGATIGKLKSLKQINVNALPLTDEFVTQIKELPNLEVFNLGRTKVGDASLTLLAGFPKLKRVMVYGTAVTEGGAQTLRAKPMIVDASEAAAERDQNTSGSSGGRLGNF